MTEMLCQDSPVSGAYDEYISSLNPKFNGLGQSHSSTSVFSPVEWGNTTQLRVVEETR